MKYLSTLLLVALMCLTLCACETEAPGIVGTWESSGTVSIIGENAPMPTEISEHWTFSDDNTASVEVITPETVFPPMEYTYTLENGVLTLTANGHSTEFSCETEAHTMTWNGTLVFTRLE